MAHFDNLVDEFRPMLARAFLDAQQLALLFINYAAIAERCVSPELTYLLTNLVGTLASRGFFADGRFFLLIFWVYVLDKCFSSSVSQKNLL